MAVAPKPAAELTIEQKRAVAMASARKRLKEKSGIKTLTGTVQPQKETPSQPSTNLVDESGKPIFVKGGVENFSAGLNDAIYTTAGAPVDAARNLINWGIAGANALTGQKDLTTNMIPDDNVGGKKWLTETFEKIGVKDPDNVLATNLAERLSRMAGEGAGYTIAPEAALATLVKMGIVGKKAQGILGAMFGEAKTIRGTVGNAAAGAAAGAGAQLGMEVAPEPLKPLAATLGGLAGGVAGAAAVEAPALAGAAARVAGDFAAPLTKSGQERLAGEALQSGADNPAAVRQALEQDAEIVPGSKPTTFQQTGDMGLGAMERAAATKAPDEFQTRRAEQNAARTGTIEGVQDSGAPEAVIASVRSRLDEIERQTAATLDRVTATAQGKAADLGPGRAPDDAGDAMRQTIEAARAAAKEEERALWRAVDPDGTLSLPAVTTRGRVASIREEMPASAKPPEGEEAAIFNVAASYDDVVPFSELTALQSRLKTEMRNERIANGESPAYRRMSMLNSAIQDDLEGVITQQVAQENQAVAAGQMAVENTIAAKLQREIDAWRTRAETGTGSAEGAGAAGAGRASDVPAGRGAEGPAVGGPRNAAGDSGLPVYDPAAVERLRSARAATKDRVERFDNKTLAGLRQRPSTTSPYDMPSSAVPAKVFFPGARSADAIATYRQAVGDEQALPILRDYAIDRLRRVALREDGTLDPAKLAAWRRNHADALKALPELDDALKDAGKASEAIAEAAAARKTTLAEEQKGVLGQVLGVTEPSEVTKVIGSIFARKDAVVQMRRLREAIKGDKEAEQGLRKAIVDHILERFVSNTEAATSGAGLIKSDQFQTFIAQNKPALKAAGFTDDELKMMDRVADDLRRANRSLTAVKIPGQSNTAQDVLAAKINDSPSSVLTKIVIGSSLTGGGAGWFLGPIAGIATTIGVGVVSVLRQNGLNKVDDVIKEALLNPAYAKVLLSKVKPEDAKAADIVLAQRLRRAFAASTLASSEE